MLGSEESSILGVRLSCCFWFDFDGFLFPKLVFGWDERGSERSYCVKYIDSDVYNEDNGGTRVTSYVGI